MFSVSQCDGYVQKCSNDIQALSNGKIGVFDHIRLVKIRSSLEFSLVNVRVVWKEKFM